MKLDKRKQINTFLIFFVSFSCIYIKQKEIHYIGAPLPPRTGLELTTSGTYSPSCEQPLTSRPSRHDKNLAFEDVHKLVYMYCATSALGFVRHRNERLLYRTLSENLDLINKQSI